MMRFSIALFQPRRVLLLVAIGIVGVLTGRFVGMLTTPPPLPVTDQTDMSTTSPHDSAAFLVTASDTMEQMVAKADIIVIGTIGKKVAEPRFLWYSEQGQPLTAKDMNVPENWESRFHDFAINVEQVIKDDGTIAAQKPLILRTRFARETAEFDPRDLYPGDFPGDRYLMFLFPEPDGSSYSFYYGVGSRLVIDGPTVTQSDGARSPLPFAKDVALPEFLTQVRETMKQQEIQKQHQTK